MIAILWLFAAALTFGVAAWSRRRWLRFTVIAFGLLALSVSVYCYWYEHRTVPGATSEVWFDGITYQRVIRTEPRALIVHIVTIDLDAADIGFLVTPPMNLGEHPLVGQTTSDFLRQHQLQVAINGSFFFPWHSNGPFDYYPHTGDPVSVNGLAISNGKRYSRPANGHYALLLTKDNRAAIANDLTNAWQGISGREIFVKDGAFVLDAKTALLYSPHEPRTAFALSKDQRTLMLVVVDGRQPNYSEGVSVEELASLLIEHGAWTALHMDGGGSSTLVRADDAGEPVVINSPIHGRHPPGRERPVANHLGVFAKRK